MAWRLAADSDVKNVISSPGNPGMADIGPLRPVAITDPARVVALATESQADLVVIGPEAPLDAGVSDALRQQGFPVIGPSRAAAQLECSKVFAKRFMERHGIPTAACEVHAELAAALSLLASRRLGVPVVVKADGLAAGKGVVVAMTQAEAEVAVRACLADGAFGAAGSTVVIEECLTGPEVSFFVLCDGTRAVALGSAQDHKRAFDDDKGPNTGGMGAFAPSALVTSEVHAFAMDVADRVMKGLKADGLGEYRGFLYISLMLTPRGPMVIEFNVRFGDPEAQVLLPAIEGPFARVLRAAAEGDLRAAPSLALSSEKFVGVVLASGGYPGSISLGHPVTGLGRAGAMPGVVVFHAGTRVEGDQIVTNGGRVFTVVGRGPTFADAMTRAYAAAALVEFEGKQHRTDIARRAL